MYDVTLIRRHDELVLDEAPRAVEQVPVGDGIEGMEEGGQRDQGPDSRRGALRNHSSLKARAVFRPTRRTGGGRDPQ